MKSLLTIFILITLQFSASAQDVTALVNKVKAKLDVVNDYVADGKMRTDVAFIKAPLGRVKVYFKKPNKFRLKKDDNGCCHKPYNVYEQH